MKVIYCAGEQARVLLDILQRCDDDEEVVLIDDDDSRHGERIDGVEVSGGSRMLERLSPDEDRCLVAYGQPGDTRTAIARRIANAGFSFFSAIDPEATVSSTAVVGDGVTVNAQTYLGPGVEIADHVLVDSAVNVSHDTHLERGVTVTPNASIAGNSIVRKNAYVGTGATIVDHVTVGAGAIVGAGATVTEDIAPEATVVGTPARPI